MKYYLRKNLHREVMRLSDTILLIATFCVAPTAALAAGACVSPRRSLTVATRGALIVASEVDPTVASSESDSRLTVDEPIVGSSNKAEPDKDADRSRLVGDISTIVQSAAVTGAFYYIVIQLLDDDWLSQPVHFS